MDLGTQAEGRAIVATNGLAAELALVALGEHMLRVTLLPIRPDGTVAPLRPSPELDIGDEGHEIATLRISTRDRTMSWGDREIRVSADLRTIGVTDARGRALQRLSIAADGEIGFALGLAPLFGLGQGGQQFDRRGGVFAEINGQGEGEHSVDMNAPGARAPVAPFDLAAEGARITIPWIVSAEGWALYLHRPTGCIDLSGAEGRLVSGADSAPLPLDAFLVVAPDPAAILRQYARLTGYPHLPPLWSLGYLQSHRTLASEHEVLAEAAAFRARGLPCDGMIYLGTGFCPDGWNTGHGAFDFNPRVFPDPEATVQRLHESGFRVVLHVVDPPLHLHGEAGDADSDAEHPDHAASYWRRHQRPIEAGVDGWWPDVGDKLAPDARLARMRMYRDGSLQSQPGRRPFALHRNAAAGVQRYGWLWSGDVDSAWRTLAMQVPVGLNCGLTGIPFWGSDTGGFITTPELTGELFVRWFQYSSFCPSFRGHGRTWRLRRPWGWNTGEYGPEEFDFRRVALPDARELNNPAVEPICRAYLELRYRLLPYLYSAVHEANETGLPVMRALWLHYPSDPAAVACGDAYLWGRDILVAPVTEKGAASRTLYLPGGQWHDFWTGERVEGGQRITRPVDLATLPIYVRSGAIIATGPTRQTTAEPSNEPLLLTVYPGEDGSTTLYEDDGSSLDHLRGDWQAFHLTWHEATRRLGLSLLPGSRAMTAPRPFSVKLNDAARTTMLTFHGEPMEAVL